MVRLYRGEAKWSGRCANCGATIEKGDKIFVIDEGFLIAKLKSICPECKQKLYPNVEAKSMWRRLIGLP
jgi:DNA-directed RNA polymerase subunit RPC12/RpoP